MLQRECRELISSDGAARAYTAILEYELPLESRRIDVVVLENGIVVVLELKGKEQPSQADLDQVMAYARDLRAHHEDCHERPVYAVLVPTRATSPATLVQGVQVVGPEGLDRLLYSLSLRGDGTPLDPDRFLRVDAYRPMPSLVTAARDLFQRRDLPYIKRARAATDPAVRRISEIIREAAETRTRKLALVTGVPGSGKTLVGLRLVHDPRRLRSVATEFAAQGLELDLAILGWGNDFLREDGRWTNRLARKHKHPELVKDPLQLRRNAYRVLLTRGRDGTVVFVPPVEELRETVKHLRECGFRELV